MTRAKERETIQSWKAARARLERWRVPIIQQAVAAMT